MKRTVLALLLINGLLVPLAVSADTNRSWYGTYELEVRLPPGRAEGKVGVISKAILVLTKHAVQRWPQLQAEQKAFLEYMKGLVRQLKAQRKRQHQEPEPRKN